jgi:hypothetical protein
MLQLQRLGNGLAGLVAEANPQKTVFKKQKAVKKKISLINIKP